MWIMSILFIYTHNVYNLYLYIIVSYLIVLKETDKNPCELNPPENINDFEMNTENSDMQSEIINPSQSIDNVENYKDNNIEIEEYENTDIYLYGKDFEPKVNILNGIIYCKFI